MRWFFVAVALTGFCGTAQPREALGHPPDGTPSIMVDGKTEKPSRARRDTVARPRTRRTQDGRIRALVLPRPSTIYETETRSINSSIGEQQQRLQTQQRQQIENNLFRQEIQRSTISPVGTPSLGCTPGSLAC